MSNGPYHVGGCECGTVTLMATGLPRARVRCDCAACDGQWLGLWAEERVMLSEGLEALASRWVAHGGVWLHCARCGELVLVEHAAAELVLVPTRLLDAPGESDEDGASLLARLGHDGVEAASQP